MTADRRKLRTPRGLHDRDLGGRAGETTVRSVAIVAEQWSGDLVPAGTEVKNFFRQMGLKP